jgi:hypothetical protein
LPGVAETCGGAFTAHVRAVTMPFDLPAEHVLPLLRRRGGEWASDAKAAWGSLTAGGEAPVVTLPDLQNFLWFTLPTKFLMSADDPPRPDIRSGDLHPQWRRRKGRLARSAGLSRSATRTNRSTNCQIP